ncbi:MAG: sigma-70 family RNA polymerase sigma factor [Armatimonadota bacterium]|nr:sigma-70 family RNA polymerase sigma factor [Armatimonadota bacterium]
MTDDPSDTELAALRAGDPRAFLALVERYQERLYNFAARMCRHREDAKDVLQDTLLSAARALKDFRGEGKLSTWLFRIAANACRKMRRRGAFEPERELSLEEFMPGTGPEGQLEIVDWQDAPDAALERARLREELEAAIAGLPLLYREVLLLRDVEGLSTEATAEALGLTEAAVKTRLHRARLFVRQRLARDWKA